jgi:hypothetical protein
MIGIFKGEPIRCRKANGPSTTIAAPDLPGHRGGHPALPIVTGLLYFYYNSGRPGLGRIEPGVWPSSTWPAFALLAS